MYKLAKQPALCMYTGVIYNYNYYVATPSEVHVKHSSYKAFNPTFDSFFATSNTLGIISIYVSRICFTISISNMRSSSAKIYSESDNNLSTIYIYS